MQVYAFAMSEANVVGAGGVLAEVYRTLPASHVPHIKHHLSHQASSVFVAGTSKTTFFLSNTLLERRCSTLGMQIRMTGHFASGVFFSSKQKNNLSLAHECHEPYRDLHLP